MKNNFSVVKFGYDMQEVDDFIDDLVKGVEKRLTEQYNQIDILIKKNSILIEEINRQRRITQNTELLTPDKRTRTTRNGNDGSVSDKSEFINVNDHKDTRKININVKALADSYDEKPLDVKSKLKPSNKNEYEEVPEKVDGKFDVDEALNPTDSLEELSRKLGLI